MSQPGSKRLEEKTAIVTGAGSGIGRAIAQRFGREGARVLLVGRTAASLQETAATVVTAGGDAAALAADVGDPDSAQAVDAWLDANFGGTLDVLVNCAAIYELCPIPELTPAGWRRSMNTNLRGPFLLMQRATARMASRGGGAVINVSTVNSLIGDRDVGIAAYAASKGGLNGLTRQAGVEFADRGVRVNAVVPGVVDTGMISEWRESEIDLDSWLREHVPLGRLARPEEVADVCLFLASDDSRYITASLFPVDGGMTAV